MRVLWVCNRPVASVSKDNNKSITNKEGWLDTLFEMLESNSDIEMGLCHADAGPEKDYVSGSVKVYTLNENYNTLHVYEDRLEERFMKIYEDFKPDIVHIFGTEYPHTLGAVKAIENKDKVLISLQGICDKCAEHYLDFLPKSAINHLTLRDVLKGDTLKKQKKHFMDRAENEKKALKEAMNVTGRTEFDREYSKEINKDARYFYLGETLRNVFYTGDVWNEENIDKHVIYFSQGNYPIKGLHVMLEALNEVVKVYPDTVLKVGGDIITGGTLKKNLLIGAYGSYIKKYIKKNNLGGNVEFTGNIPADRVKENLLSSSVFVSASVIENSPNSVAEAMILGVPVISSYVGGVPSIMMKDVDGRFFDSGDKDMLAGEITDLFKKKDLGHVKDMIINARNRAVNDHNSQTNYETLLDIYKEIDSL